LEHATRALALMPHLMHLRMHVIASLAQLGRVDEMRHASEAFRARFPAFRLATHAEWLSSLPNLRGEPLNTYLSGLHFAGIPE
jgi:hypothetical protein